MICPIFFENSVNIEEKYLCDEVIANFYIIQNIDCDNPLIAKRKIEMLFENDVVNNSKYRKYYSSVIKKYKCKDLNDEIDLVNQFHYKYLNACLLSKEELLNKISPFLYQTFFDQSEFLSYVYALDKLLTNKKDIYYGACFLNHLLNENEHISNIDSAIIEIKEAYNNISIKQLINNNILCEILFANNINLIKEFKELSVNAIMCIASLDYSNIYQSLFILKDDHESNLKENMFNVFSVLDERMNEIISLRYGFNGKKKTLEEIGLDYSLTRERIRQIEKKASQLIVPRATLVNSQLISLFNYLSGSDGKYITCENLKEYCKDDDLYNCIIYIIQNCNLSIKYNEDLQIIYNFDIATPEEFANEIIDVFGNMIEKSIIDSFDECEKRVISNYYRLQKNAVYLRRGLPASEIVCKVIDEIFPDGYKIDDEDNYQTLCRELKNRFGEDFEISSRRAFDGLMGRKDYCLCGRGLYKNRNLCVVIPDDLLAKIIDFVSQKSPVCNYLTIYEEFKNELEALGINNYYYMKGLIDPHLPSEFTTTRNCIQTTSEKIRSYDAIVMKMKSYENVFSLEDLKNEFVGVKDYTFYSVIYPESLNNGLIWLSDKRFIYIEKLNIDTEAKDELRKIIEELFVSMNEETISSRKIYARLSLVRKDIIDSLKVCEDSFALFGIIRALFPKEYGYNRPLISKDVNLDTNSTNLIYNYAKGLDSFNVKMINSYVNKMNIRGLYSYLSFMESLSEDFVQINVDSMVKKERINLNQNQLDEISNLINLMINRFGEIDTNDFKGYIMLPKLNYQWNKYLLVGIIRTYLSDKFDISNTETSYDLTNFIIRRVK